MTLKKDYIKLLKKMDVGALIDMEEKYIDALEKKKEEIISIIDEILLIRKIWREKRARMKE